MDKFLVLMVTLPVNLLIIRHLALEILESWRNSSGYYDQEQELEQPDQYLNKSQWEQMQSQCSRFSGMNPRSLENLKNENIYISLTPDEKQCLNKLKQLAGSSSENEYIRECIKAILK